MQINSQIYSPLHIHFIFLSANYYYAHFNCCFLW